MTIDCFLIFSLCHYGYRFLILPTLNRWVYLRLCLHVNVRSWGHKVWEVDRPHSSNPLVKCPLGDLASDSLLTTNGKTKLEIHGWEGPWCSQGFILFFFLTSSPDDIFFIAFRERRRERERKRERETSMWERSIDLLPLIHTQTEGHMCPHPDQGSNSQPR